MEREFSKLKPEEQGMIDEIFNLFDTAKSGKLEAHEFKVALQALEYDVAPPNFVGQLRKWGAPRPGWQEVAVDEGGGGGHGSGRGGQHGHGHGGGGGCPDVMLEVTQPRFRECAAEIVRARDPNHDVDRSFDFFAGPGGLITVADLRRVVGQIGRDDVPDDTLHSMIAAFDMAGKGGVDRNEFRAMMRENPSR